MISYKEAYKELTLAVIENRPPNIADDIDEAGVFAAAWCRLSRLYWNTDRDKAEKLLQVCRFSTFPRSQICLGYDREVVFEGKDKVDLRKFIDVIKALKDDDIYAQSITVSVSSEKQRSQ